MWVLRFQQWIPRLIAKLSLRICPTAFFNRSISYLCAANIFFTEDFKETSLPPAFSVASQINLMTLSGLFVKIHEIISGFSKWRDILEFLSD